MEKLNQQKQTSIEKVFNKIDFKGEVFLKFENMMFNIVCFGDEFNSKDTEGLSDEEKKDIEKKKFKRLLNVLYDNEISQVITNNTTILNLRNDIKNDICNSNTDKDKDKENDNENINQDISNKNAKTKLKKKSDEDSDNIDYDSDSNSNEEDDDEESEKSNNSKNDNNSNDKENNDNNNSLLELLDSSDIEFFSFNSDIFKTQYFIDKLNDLIYYLQTPLEKSALLIYSVKDFNLFENLNSSEITNYELFVLLAYIIKTKLVSLNEAITILEESIKKDLANILYIDDDEEVDSDKPDELKTNSNDNNNNKDNKDNIDNKSTINFKVNYEINNNDEEKDNNTILLVKLIKNHLIKELEDLRNSSSEDSLLKSQLSKFDKDLNRVEECVFKCNQCRKTIFSDLDLDYYHVYTPKIRYSFKRYKHSFVKSSAECASYFLRSVEDVFVKEKYEPKDAYGKKLQKKVNYKYEDFYNTMMKVRLQCTKVSYYY